MSYLFHGIPLRGFTFVTPYNASLLFPFTTFIFPKFLFYHFPFPYIIYSAFSIVLIVFPVLFFPVSSLPSSRRYTEALLLGTHYIVSCDAEVCAAERESSRMIQDDKSGVLKHDILPEFELSKSTYYRFIVREDVLLLKNLP